MSLALISGIAYIVVLAGATGTAERLLVDRAARVVEGQVATIKSRLDPVTEQLELIAALAAAGRIDVNSPVAVREALAVMMSRVPEVSVAAFATLDLQLHRAIRHPDGTIARDTVSLTRPAAGLERFRELQTSHSTFWGELFWSDAPEAAAAQRAHAGAAHRRRLHRRPGRHGRRRRPFLPDRRSRGAAGGRYFILVDHDKVLAHRRLIDPRGLDLSEDKPLPTIHEVDDPILAKIWDPPVRSPQIDRALGDLGHVVEVGGRRWVFVYREITGYGPEPWLVGQYFPDRGRDRRPRPADERRHRRRRHARRRRPAGAADGPAHGALDPHHHHRGRGDRAAGVRRADARPLAAARDRRCRPQPRQGARRAEMVRRLRAAAPGAPPDGGRRGRRRVAPAHRSR